MKPFKSLLYTLSVATIMGALTIAPARHSQASNQQPISTQIRYRPDLVVTEVVPVYSSVFAWSGRVLVKDQVWIKVTNQGSGAAGTYGCFFQWDYGYGNEQEYFWQLGGLGAGQSTWILADAKGYDLWAGGHRFQFVVNYDHGLVETDYTNNVYNSP